MPIPRDGGAIFFKRLAAARRRSTCQHHGLSTTTGSLSFLAADPNERSNVTSCEHRRSIAIARCKASPLRNAQSGFVSHSLAISKCCADGASTRMLAFAAASKRCMAARPAARVRSVFRTRIPMLERNSVTVQVLTATGASFCRYQRKAASVSASGQKIDSKTLVSA